MGFDSSVQTWFSGLAVVELLEQETTSTTGHWRELWSTPYLRTSAVVAGGVVLYSTNEFLTISMLPSTINEIGGERIYSWVTTLYLVGSVVAAATVNSLLERIGSCLSYLLGFAVLGAGSLVCAAAPNMEVLLAGRFLQGLAGGLLCGLSFAVINAVLPRYLWSRGAAMASATWGIGALLGHAERGDVGAGTGRAVGGQLRTGPRPRHITDSRAVDSLTGRRGAGGQRGVSSAQHRRDRGPAGRRRWPGGSVSGR
jgi:Major Facilitator Superfamily